jgi:hypothetical protein
MSLGVLRVLILSHSPVTSFHMSVANGASVGANPTAPAAKGIAPC